MAKKYEIAQIVKTKEGLSSINEKNIKQTNMQEK